MRAGKMRASLPRSIRNRILMGAVLILGLLVLLLAGIARQYSVRAADEAFDRVLGAAALSMADALQLEEGFVTVDVPQAAFEMLGSARSTRVFYRVAAPNGAFLTGYYDLAADEPEPQSAALRLTDSTYRGAPIRLASLGRYIVAGEMADWAVVRVAETREARNTLADELFRNILLPVLLACSLALLLVWVGVSRAFAPFGQLREELAQRQSSDLQPLTGTYPREVGALVRALNDFMARLATSFATTRTLVADAAHQLRTPIAALQAQAQLAQNETDPVALRHRIGRIHANALIVGQLQSQLLASATIAHRLEAQPRTPVNMRDILAEIVDRLDDDALARLDLHNQPEGAPTLVLGEPIALREMLRNIVDNAFCYVPTGLITLSLSADPAQQQVIVEVSDSGPGIRDEEKPLVFERFRRGDSARETPGSGLGLSIARDVALACHGALDLTDTPGGGLTVRVRLPLHAEADPQHGRRGAVLMLAGLCLLACALPRSVKADDRLFPAISPFGSERLIIASDGEHQTMAGLIAAFQVRYPTIAVEYRALPAGLVYQSVITAAVSDNGPDLVVSGAVDLQVKLVNDGYARQHQSTETERLPDWARWRNELFGLTYQPMVFAYDPRAIKPADMPRTRLRLAQFLESNIAAYRGRVITYDIGRSGVGYIYAAFEAGVSPLAWRLMRALGDVEARLAETSLEMLGALEKGEAAIAFNLAGSTEVYERARATGLAIVATEDYRIVTTQTALVPRSARNLAAATRFLDFILSPAGQDRLGEAALLPETPPPQRRSGVPETTIPLGPAMLGYSDQRKRGRFLDTWIQLVLKP